MDAQAAQVIASLVVAVATVVSAVVAIIYTITTIRLLRTTKNSLDTMRDAFKLNFLLAYKDAGGGTGIARLVASLGGHDTTGMRDREQARYLDRLLKSGFPELYEEIKAAMGQQPSPTTPSV